MKCPVVVIALIVLPLPTLAQDSSALIASGRALFNDTKLSGDGQYSCASCHPNGHTNNKTYVGGQIVADGDPAGRNTPTLWGAGDRQAGWSWAGNMPTIQSAIRAMIVDRMKGPEPAQATLDALAAYTRSLPYGPAPFLNDDGVPSDSAPPAVKRGYALFSGKAGCANCHEPPSYDSKGSEDVGSGGVFNAPSLRSVSKTAPYFHDGRFKTLEEAVDAMSYGAVSLMTDAYRKKAGVSDSLSDAEKSDIVAFLKAL
ncbi:MAG: cytochrome-c peroxidase [Reyranella sp.]